MEGIVLDIKGAIEDLSYRSTMTEIPQINFLMVHLFFLESYVGGKLTRIVANFRKALLEYNFENPLNFIMVPHDFHEFYRVFYHAKMLVEYGTNITTDSFFSAHQARNPDDTMLKSHAKADKKHKEELAKAMAQALEDET